jgi:protein TonB
LGFFKTVNIQTMLLELSPYMRFFFCLLLSTVVHGGAAFFDWMTAPAVSSLSDSPVAVSLILSTEKATPFPLAEPRAVDRTLAAPKHKAKRKLSKTIKSPPVTVPSRILQQQTLVPVPVQDKARAQNQSEDMVCMVTQDVTSEQASVMPTTLLSARAKDLNDVKGKLPVANRVHTMQAAVVESVPESKELVDAVPNYRSNPLPKYPVLARQKRWQGVVWLLVDVSIEGEVEDLIVEQSCGHSVLDREAVRTVRTWSFTPATRAGQPTASQVRIPLRFRLEES